LNLTDINKVTHSYCVQEQAEISFKEQYLNKYYRRNVKHRSVRGNSEQSPRVAFVEKGN
jgi:hypothetical protein